MSKGLNRLIDLSRLPLIDTHSYACYEGSISKTGDNADWDWGLYQDENGEWVLMEADGAGCIFNFTQHRYPTSAEPTFHFYFDHSKTPQFSITPKEFGSKYPFIKPLADIYVGPDDNGRGPIWVVRSFVPMEFKTHCKVTSTIKLEGCDKEKGEGGWGHITYHLYENAENLTTFHADDDFDKLLEMYTVPPTPITTEHTYSASDEISANSVKTVFVHSFEGTVCGIDLKVHDFKPELLNDLWINIYYDGNKNPFVRAPIGTFFGCEYGFTKANIQTALLTWDITESTANFANYFPMPFGREITIALSNRSNESVSLHYDINYTNEKLYDAGCTGYFTSAPYYEKTANVSGKNSVIADIEGCGQMAYGVISGYDIECGCEGDVRVFIDNLKSPAIESDGTESWGSYGWGFVTPPQCNPFSAYNGVPDSNNTWSELRLTLGDSYPFRSRLRFELEHGCQNDGGGSHSGQIFCYLLPEKRVAEEIIAEIDLKAEVPFCDYRTDGNKTAIRDRFENGIHENYYEYSCFENMSYSTFTIDLEKNYRGLILKRVSLQKNSPMTAEVFVGDEKITERNWIFADSNPHYALLEDSFLIPEKYIDGQEKVAITIKPTNPNWNECYYKIFGLLNPER